MITSRVQGWLPPFSCVLIILAHQLYEVGYFPASEGAEGRLALSACSDASAVIHNNTRTVHRPVAAAVQVDANANYTPDLSQVSAVSPDGRLSVAFTFDPMGSNASLTSTFSISRHTNAILLPSVLRFMFGSGGGNKSVRVSRVETRNESTHWHNAWGEQTDVPDVYNEMSVIVELRTSKLPENASVAEFTLVVRAYDEGVAFRYFVPESSRKHELWSDFKGDEIEYNLAAGSSCYWTDGAQRTYTRMPFSNWTSPCEPPLTIEAANGMWISLLQAAQVNFPRMRYRLGPESNQVLTQLGGALDFGAAGFMSPWHVIMVADSPGELLEHNYILLNLNPPRALEDTTWIRPGRVLRLMQFTLDVDVVRMQMKFAAGQNFTYIHLDAGWYGDEYDPASDATRWNASRLDLPLVIHEAKAHGLGVILYVNHLALETQMDELFPLYKEWGVDGVKFGFVNVGAQKWTIWLHNAIKKAAEYKLIVDVHDDYRPTGFSRTYPNLLQVEGIQGDELFPSANQSTIYPFTRFLAGQADHTYCFLNLRLKKTKAHQLALSIINFGPLQYLLWYDVPQQYVKNTQRRAEIEVWKDLPTVWDETKVIMAVPGEYVAVARRKGETWWVGVVTNEDARNLTLALDFMWTGAETRNASRYHVSMYEDADPQTIKMENVHNGAAADVAIKLRSSGGTVMRIHRMK